MDLSLRGLMDEANEGRCSICDRTVDEVGKKTTELDVDHTHETGVVGGLLCRKCNTALGLFDHDPERLRMAADYVAFHRNANRILGLDSVAPPEEEPPPAVG
jgi:hypothetical protein